MRMIELYEARYKQERFIERVLNAINHKKPFTTIVLPFEQFDYAVKVLTRQLGQPSPAYKKTITWIGNTDDRKRTWEVNIRHAYDSHGSVNTIITVSMDWHDVAV